MLDFQCFRFKFLDSKVSSFSREFKCDDIDFDFCLDYSNYLKIAL